MNTKLLRAEWRALRRASFRTMHHSLSVVGLIAVAGGGIAMTHPEYARSAAHWIAGGATSPAAAATEPTRPDPFAGPIEHPTAEAGRLLGLLAPGADDDAVVMRPVSTEANAGTSREQREVGRYLARRYRVNPDALAMLVDAAYVTGRDLKMDPSLLLAVMAIESGFNPFAESTAGASGLMQLMSKVHREKLDEFGGANIALNPVANLRVGAVVLKDCIRRGGSVANGLRLYVGAGTGDDNGYGARVLQEKERIVQAIHGNASRNDARAAPLPAAKASAPAAAPAVDAEPSDADGAADHKDATPPKPEARRVASI